jgi:integrase
MTAEKSTSQTRGKKQTRKITTQVVDWLSAEAKAAGEALLVWDCELKGFGIRAGKSGQVSAHVQWWRGGKDGKATRHTVCHYGQPAPAGAMVDGKPLPAGRIVTTVLMRKLCAAEIARVKAGIDPQQERRQAAQRMHGATLGQAVERYLGEAGKGRKSWDQTRRALEFELSPQGAAHELVARPFAELRRKDFVNLRDKISSRSESTCRAVFAHLRPLMTWALDRDLIGENPLKGVRPPAPPASRDRILDDAELAAVWGATEILPHPMGAIYRLLILLGQRREEVAEMAWSELNVDRAAWIIPAGRAKNKHEHVVDLSPQALAIIAAVPRHLGNDRVFPHGVDFFEAKKRIDAHAAGALGKSLPAWRTHDLRRTFATGLAGMGYPPHIVERCINHRSGAAGGMVAVYQRHEYRAERKAAFAAWGSHVEALITCKSDTELLRQASNG